MTTEEMIQALEAAGFTVQRPEQPKGPVMEPEDGKQYWHAYPDNTERWASFDQSSNLDCLFSETCRLFHTQAEAIERNEQAERGEWAMIHVPTEWNRFYRDVLGATDKPGFTIADYTDAFFRSLTR